MAWERIGAAQNADRNLYVGETIWTGTPDASSARLCQLVIALGDGTKNLSGAGGTFEIKITIGGNVWLGRNDQLTVGTAPRTLLYTSEFIVGANQSFSAILYSPNASDTDVDVTAELYAESSPSIGSFDAAMSDIDSQSEADTLRFDEITERTGNLPDLPADQDLVDSQFSDLLSAISTQLVTQSQLRTGDFRLHCGVDLLRPFNVTVPANWEKIYFTAKNGTGKTDPTALIQVVLSNPADADGDGVLRLLGSDGYRELGSLEVSEDRTQITLAMTAAATLLLEKQRPAEYDFRIICDDGSVPYVAEPGTVSFVTLVADVTE